MQVQGPNLPCFCALRGARSWVHVCERAGDVNCYWGRTEEGLGLVGSANVSEGSQLPGGVPEEPR